MVRLATTCLFIMVCASLNLFAAGCQRNGPGDRFPAGQSSPELDSGWNAMVERPVGDYFTADLKPRSKPGKSISPELSPEALKLFRDDFDKIVRASGQKGVLDETAFRAWWAANEKLYLNKGEMKRWKDMPMGAFIMLTWFRSQSVQPEAEKNPGWFSSKMSATLANPWVKTVLGSTAVVVGYESLQVFYSYALRPLGNTIYYSVVMGPISDMVRAGTEPVMKPFREKLAQYGLKVLNRPGVYLTMALSQSKKADQVAEEGKQIISRFRRERDSAATIETIESLKSEWAKWNQSVLETFVPSLKDGRAMMMEPIRQARSISSALEISDERRLTSLQELDRLKNAIRRSVSEQELTELLSKIDQLYDPRPGAVELANAAELAPHKEKLLAKGVKPATIDRLIQTRYGFLLAEDRMAATMAEWILYEIQYPEFDRLLPPDARKISQIMRKHSGYNYYLELAARRLPEVLDALEVEVEITRLKMKGTALEDLTRPILPTHAAVPETHPLVERKSWVRCIRNFLRS